jgi:large subunit ribosomal protein L23
MSIFNKLIKKKNKSDHYLEKSLPGRQSQADEPKEAKSEMTMQDFQEKKIKKQDKVKKTDTKDAYKVLIKPMITEKGTYLNSENKHVFQVATFANKIMIRKAFWHLYGVWPIKVNIVNIQGKNTRYGKISGRTKDRKKAIITLKKSDEVKVHEGV